MKTPVKKHSGQPKAQGAPTTKCDFCSSPSPLWRYPARSFLDPLLAGAASLGDWLACADCHAFIQARDYRGLIERVEGRFATPAGVDPGLWRIVLRGYLDGLYRDFERHRTGKAIPCRVC